ncbi:MAG: hypothetical protein COA75_05925 [Cellvibrionales bacterium]|nr:MAG: hypothetical protein COA75_05925 [Cellvibrionales bacterium]
MQTLENIGVGINVGALIGHTPTRLYVMGDASTEREATPEEVKQMREIVRDALKAGAIGFATSKASTHIGAGGKPVPSRLANYKDEILEIVKVIGEEKQGIIQSTIGTDVLHDQFSRSAEINAAGARVFPQVSPRSLSFDMNMKAPFLFESMEAFKPVSAADIEGCKKLYADPEFRANFKAEVLTGKFVVLGG